MNGKSKLTRTLSVPTPFSRACKSSPYYYQSPGVLPSLQSLFPDLSISPMAVSRPLYTALVICSLYAMRVNELIKLTNSHVIEGDRVLCPGSKGSHSYIIYVPGISRHVALGNVSRETYPLFPWTYHQFYRAFIKVGIYLNRGVSPNNKVTHASRYLMANLANNGFSSSVAGQILRHKSSKSVSYYLN